MPVHIKRLCTHTVHVPGDGGGQQPVGMAQHMPGPAHQPMGPTVQVGQHHTAMQQQQVNGNYYHHGNINGAPPPSHMGGGGGIPPPGGPPGPGGYGMYPAPPGPGSVDSHTPSTHMTELITSPAGSHSSQLNFTGMMSPAGAGNTHNTGFSGDGAGGMHMGRPHDLPIHNTHVYHGYPAAGEQSNMYCNSDAPVGEQIEYRQPPFATVGGEDLMCGQGTYAKRC